MLLSYIPKAVMVATNELADEKSTSGTQLMSTMRLCPSSTAPVSLDLNQLSDLLSTGKFTFSLSYKVGSDRFDFINVLFKFNS